MTSSRGKLRRAKRVPLTRWRRDAKIGENSRTREVMDASKETNLTKTWVWSRKYEEKCTFTPEQGSEGLNQSNRINETVNRILTLKFKRKSNL